MAGEYVDRLVTLRLCCVLSSLIVSHSKNLGYATIIRASKLMTLCFQSITRIRNTYN